MVSELTGGWTDTALTENGKNQALAVAKWLADELYGQKLNLYCSDLKRARQTAEPIVESLDLKPSYHIELREKNNGKAAGLTVDEARLYFNEPPPELHLDWLPYDGGETWREFYTRVCDFMNRVYPTIKDSSIFVCHGGSIHMIVSWWLMLEPESMNKVFFDMDPTGVTVLYKAMYGNHLLERLNDTSHLAENCVKNPFPIRET
jgi:probable phosphoglycerate mutase